MSKHIKVLETVGVVRRRTKWRTHYIEVRMDPLSEIDRWFAELRSIWAQRLDAQETPLSEESPHD